MSTPVNVCAKFIAVFIIFGAFLERTGISNLFIDLANSLVGSASGGPAKVAVISSALCGMIAEMSAAGSLMILALGFNILGVTKIKVADMLPAIIFAPFVSVLFAALDRLTAAMQG